ncbi:unnamed protein product [Caenorhabditis nigoni]
MQEVLDTSPIQMWNEMWQGGLQILPYRNGPPLLYLCVTSSSLPTPCRHHDDVLHLQTNDEKTLQTTISTDETMDQAPVGATTSRDAVVTIPGTNQDAETRAATRDDRKTEGIIQEYKISILFERDGSLESYGARRCWQSLGIVEEQCTHH